MTTDCVRPLCMASYVCLIKESLYINIHFTSTSVIKDDRNQVQSSSIQFLHIQIRRLMHSDAL